MRKDTNERHKNVDLVLNYYKKIIPNSKFIFVEDDNVKNFEYLSNIDSVSYVYFHNEGIYRKSYGYNLGLKESKDTIVCFLDIDCIVSKSNIEQAVDQVLKDNSISICYNGTSVYFEYNVKNTISDDCKNLYDYLDGFVDKNKIYTSYKCEEYEIGNTKSVGGALLGKRETFLSIGGFNPNFVGWGYEDNEIIHRCKNMMVPMYYINTKKPLLFHLPHAELPYSDKSQHEFYKNNYEEFFKISNMPHEQLKEYIKTWK